MTTTHKILQGDCRDLLKKLIDEGVKVDSIVTDPPYHLTSIVNRFSKSNLSDDTQTSERGRNRSDGYARLSTGFMGKAWDGGDIAFRTEVWELCNQILKPGGYLLAFGGSRTFHRMTCAIEDSGFEIRDVLMWIYGSGFPKSHDISKAIDKKLGKEREIIGRREHPTLKDKSKIDRQSRDQFHGNGGTIKEEWDITEPSTTEAKQYYGYGTALKPAYEPIIMARKSIEGTVAENVLKYGTGGINIDGCRIEWPNGIIPSIGTPEWGGPAKKLTVVPGQNGETVERTMPHPIGRWPANVIHDGSDEVEAEFDKYGETKSGAMKRIVDSYDGKNVTNFLRGESGPHNQRADSGSISRFFYCAKACDEDRAGSKHPTVKPVNLIRYLVKLVTPPNGIVLDPFAGSGTTLQAAFEEEFSAIGIEREDEYVKDIENRIANFPNRLTEFME